MSSNPLNITNHLPVIVDADTILKKKKFYSTHRRYVRIFTIAIFCSLVIIVGTLSISLTEPKLKGQPCQWTFKRTIHQTSTYDSRPRSVVLVDLNNDDHLDFIVANTGTDSIDFFFGQGNGTFTHKNTLSMPTRSKPTSIVINHFNNDNYLDLAVANYGTNSIQIFFGDKNGNFTDSTSYSVWSGHPWCLAVGDINQDNQTDLVVVSHSTSNLTVLFGSYDGSFDIVTILDLGYDSMAISVLLADFDDDDDHLDIALVDYTLNELVVIFFLEENNNSLVIHRYSTGSDSQPSSLVSGDFNGDQRLDIAVTNSGSHSLSIFLNNGNRTFANPLTQSMDSNCRPYSILTNDFDNDTILDLVIIDTNNNQILLLKGDGNGSFSIMTKHSTGYNSDPLSFAMGDVDEDHRWDLVITNNETNTILVLNSFLINPDASQRSYFTGNDSQPNFVAIGDINNDGHLDIVFVDTTNYSIGIFIGLGDGTFTNEVMFLIYLVGEPISILLNEMNNDSNLDVIIGMQSNPTINIYFGLGNGSFIDGESYSLEDAFALRSIDLADFNRDGILDIIIGSIITTTSIIILRYLDGRSAQFINYTGNDTEAIGFVLTSDMNIDGYVDIIASRYSEYGIGIYYGDENQSFHDPRLIYTNGTTPNNIVVGDLNNDHRLDMVYTDPDRNHLVILLADDIGNYTTIQTIFTGLNTDPSIGALADFNLDNYLDLVVVNTFEHSIAIYPNHGNGTFSSPRKFSTEYYSYPSALVLGDLNDDGQMDVIVCNSETMNVGVFIIDHLADFTNSTIYALGSAPQPYAVKMGDLNGNNETDLVIVHAGTNSLIILLDYHNGTFLDRVTYSTGAQSHPQYVIVIDLNRDHILDIIVANTWTNNIQVFLGLGNGTFDDSIEYPTGAAPSAIGVGDFDNDNRTDLAVVNRDSDTIDLFFSYDYVMFSQQHPLLIGAGQNPKVVITGDFNDDDHLDIAVLELAPGLVDIFLNNGNGTFQSTISTETAASSYPVDMASGDFNHDHHLDIVHVDDGNNFIGLMLGYGNGTFAPLRSFSTGRNYASKVAVGDMNNDHHLDVVVTIPLENQILIFLGDGTGSFIDNITYSIPSRSRPVGVLLADMNNDQILDMIITTATNSSLVLILRNSSNLLDNVTFNILGDTYDTFLVRTGDFNQDQFLDIVAITDDTRQIILYFNNGNGTFSSRMIYSTITTSTIGSIIVADLNGDTLLDLIFTEFVQGNGHISVLYGLGEGKFTRLKTYSIGNGIRLTSMASGHFNNDTRLDLVMLDSKNARSSVLFGYKMEPFTTSISVPLTNGSHPVALTVADFNEDHQLDIAVVNSDIDTFDIFYGKGQGDFIKQRTYSTEIGSRPMSIVTDDFNSDQHVDLAVINADHHTITIWLNDGIDTFHLFTNYSTGWNSNPSSIDTADMNKDSYVDLVVTTSSDNQVLIFFGHGNGTFAQSQPYSMGFNAHPQSLVIGDMNNDGWFDIAVANFGSDYVEILEQICLTN